MGRRAPHGLARHAGAPGRPRRVPAAARPRAGSGPSSSPPTSAAASAPRCRRLPRGDRHRVAGPPPRPAGAVGRDPHREHARHGPRPGPGPARDHRRHPRRHGPGLPARRHRRTPARTRRMGGDPAVHDPHDGARGLRHPEGRVHERQRRHEHDADRRLPRRRPAGGGGRHRAGHGPVRRRDRHGSRRGAAQEPRPEGRLPVHHARWARPTTVGDYERALDLALEAAGYDGAARGAGAAGARRATCSQLGIGVAVYVEVTGGPYAGNEFGQGRGARPTAAPASTPARRRTARATSPRGRCSPASSSASRWTASRSSTATPTSSPSAAARRARGRCSSAAPPCTRPSVRDGRARPRRVPPTCSRRTPTTSCSTRSTGRSTSPARPRSRKTWAEAGGGRAAGRRLDVPGGGRHLPVRRPRRRRRGRHRDRQGHRRALGRRRRRRHDPQPAPRRRPAPRRHRPGRRPGAVRGVRLRRGRQPAHVQPRRLHVHLRVPSCPASSSSPWRRRRPPTRWAPRASASRAPSAPPPRCRTRSSTPSSHLGVRHIDMPATPHRVWATIQGATS